MSLFGFLTLIAIVIVICLHVAFFVLEAFLWTRPTGRRVFGLTPELAQGSKSLAINQGLYNLFLAAGLVWSLVARDCTFEIKIFFLSCIIIAGIVGGITAKRSILFVQALPGLLTLVLVFFTQR